MYASNEIIVIRRIMPGSSVVFPTKRSEAEGKGAAGENLQDVQVQVQCLEYYPAGGDNMFSIPLGWGAIAVAGSFGGLMVTFAYLENRGIMNPLIVKGALGSVTLVLVVYAISKVPMF